jgi:carboxyl-terminal processing protease
MENQQEMYSYKQSKESKEAKNPLQPFIFALVLVFGVVIGMMVSSISFDKNKPFVNRNYDKLQDILTYIDVKYVDTVSKDKLTDDAINEMLAKLDPHSIYIPKSELGEVTEQMEGKFEGVGIEFFIVQDTITVVSAVSGGPSEEVGIKAGDRIVKINDTLVAGNGIKNDDVLKKLRGPKGTEVKVGILRAGVKKVMDFTIVRDKIPLYSIDASYMIDGQTGYIKINRFSATTYDEFVEKMENLRAQGMKKLVLDLRQNPGGYLDAATRIADEFLGGQKLLVYTQGKAYARQDYMSSRPGLFEKGDLTLLIDQGSASASEILAGAVQDYDRGTVIGRTSFGKGLVQEQYELRDGSALRLTIARYYTPSGRSIQRPYGKGSEAYYEEVYDRYAKGEFMHEDSVMNDSLVYKTAKGRKVYGGGGIRPDIFVPLDTVLNNEKMYRIKSFVPEFVYKYTSEHPEVLSKYKTVQEFKKGFDVDAALYNEFMEYVKKSINIDGQSPLALTLSPVQVESTRHYLEAFIAKQNWRMDGFYYILNDEDVVVKEALKRMNTVQ